MCALSDLSRALKIQPENIELLEARAVFWKATKNYFEAVQDYTAVINVNGNDAHLFTARGDVFMLMNKKDNACLDYKRADELGDGAAKSRMIFNCK